MAMNSTTSKCISDRVTELINKSIDMYNETTETNQIPLIPIDNHFVADNIFKWDIGNSQIIQINFKGIKNRCRDQIYIVDFLINYAFSLVNECTVGKKTRTCDIIGINAKIENMITSLIKITNKNNVQSK